MSDAGTPRIAVYVSPACPHCRATCELLAKRGVAFQTLDVTADRDALTRLIWVTGQATVPAVVVGDDILIGFDEARLLELVELARTVTTPAKPSG